MPVTILFEGDANYQPSSDRLPQICVCTANVSSWAETCPPKGSTGRVDLADHPSLLEFRFPLAL